MQWSRQTLHHVSTGRYDKCSVETIYQIEKFYGDRVNERKVQIGKTVRDVCKVVQDILKEVEVQEPRFISSLTEINGKYEGLEAVSYTHLTLPTNREV